MLSDDEIITRCRPFTMTSIERLQQSINAVDYVIKNSIDGDFIEIGVWKGGVIMSMLYKLLQLGITYRKVHLFDTFEGMTEPCEKDIDPYDRKAENIFDEVKCECSIEHVKFAIESVGYPMQNIYFHKGDIRAVNIEDIPIKIANLRLDNDWYELYKFELPIFEPNVTNGGVITIDDYGHWNGCKEAVDDYINGKNINLIKIDYTGVYWIKHT